LARERDRGYPADALLRGRRRARQLHARAEELHVAQQAVTQQNPGARKWIWKGQRIRTTSTFSEDGKVQHLLHEQSDDGVEWRAAIDVTLRRVD